MRAKWLNLILLLTNRIFNRKRAVLEQTGLKTVIGIFVLFFYEIFLGIVSLPLYLGLKPEKVTAYFEEKGGYEKIDFDYRLRRVLTLTGVGIIFFVWAIKFILILSVPNVYGPLQLYRVSDLEPVDFLQQDLIRVETQIQTARIVDTIVIPELTKAEKVKGGDYIFYGTGQPLTLAVLFLSNRQAELLTGMTDENGKWEIRHFQDEFKLKSGNHSVLAFSYDEKTGTRSKSSGVKYFKVKISPLEKIFNNADVILNFSIIIVIVLGVLLTILTL